MRVGHDLLALLGTEMSNLDFDSYYLAGALTAAHSVILNGSFYPQAPEFDQFVPAEQAAQTQQRTVDALERRLKQGFSGNGENAYGKLQWAAAYVTLTGKECWDKEDAKLLRAETAPRIRRGIDAYTDKGARIAMRSAPAFRLVFGEKLWRTDREHDHLITVAVEDLRYKVEQVLGQSPRLAPSNSMPYASAAAGLRVLEAVEIERIQGDPSRGIDIIDPPLAYRR
jgi:hypothetical protein